MSDDLIDICTAYIEKNDSSYLAKEGHVVSYVSDTGRKTDYRWLKLTVPETLRIIRATQYIGDCLLAEGHLVTAFQELGKVYEYGVKSPHDVREGVFNYDQHSDTSLGQSVAIRLSDIMMTKGFRGLRMKDVSLMMTETCRQLETGLAPREISDLIYKYFEGVGYVIKTGSKRPRVEGVLTPVLIFPDTKPSKVVTLYDVEMDAIIRRLVKELK